MMLRFFVGKNDTEVQAQKTGNPAEHYAWCLEQLLQGFENVKTDKEKLHLLSEFQQNMLLLPETKRMFEDVQAQFVSYIKITPLPSDGYIINCLSGLPIEGSDYISYNRYT